MNKTPSVSRRNFLGALGVTVGGTGLAGAGLVAGPQLVKAATEPAKGKIPDTPYRTGHMTFFTSPAAVLGEPSHKGHIMAAEEINAAGGLLGKRKIETITADEAAGITAAIGTAQTWPNVRKIANIHPDYSYGRNASEHFTLAIERLLPGTQVVSESWPKLGTTDFTAHITKIISSEPDLLYSSVWGGDYVAFYKQALRYGLFDKMKVATTLAMGVAPHAIGKDHPEGVLSGVHSNYYFTYPGGDRWPLNKVFVQRYYKRWNEYPN